MNRQEIYEHIHGTVRKPLSDALALIHDRCSPEAAGYQEFPDSADPNGHRSNAEWEALGATAEQREMYTTWLRLLHDSKSFAAGLSWIKDEKCAVSHALDILVLRMKLLDRLQNALDPETDRQLIQQLGKASNEATHFIRQQSVLAS